VDEGRKRVIAIIAGILVVKQVREENFRQNGVSPRAHSVISNAVTWAERILRHADGVFVNK
jgi:hypothetical protein